MGRLGVKPGSSNCLVKALFFAHRGLVGKSKTVRELIFDTQVYLNLGWRAPPSKNTLQEMPRVKK